MLPTVIGLVGPIRSGKTKVAELLVSGYDYKLASNSDVLGRILTKLGLDSSRANLGRLGNALFEEFGNDAIARSRLRNINEGRIVVDGIRYPEEVEAYRSLTEFLLISVVASDGIRYARAAAAQNIAKEGGTLSQEDFQNLSLARSELNVPSIMEEADHSIVNTGTTEELSAQLDSILGSLLR